VSDHEDKKHQNRERLLIRGIPGTGKTARGNAFAGDVTFDLNCEDSVTRRRFASFPEDVFGYDRDIVVTLGFMPTDLASVNAVKGNYLFLTDHSRLA